MAPGAADADPTPQHGNGAANSDAAAPDGSVRGFVRCFEELFAAAEGLVEIQADRARLSLRRTIVKAVVAVGVAASAIVWLGVAAYATVRGICGGLTELWGGRAWLGELTGGVLALAIVGGGYALYTRLSARRELERLQAKYERMRNGPERQDEPELPTEVRGRAP